MTTKNLESHTLWLESLEHDISDDPKGLPKILNIMDLGHGMRLAKSARDGDAQLLRVQWPTNISPSQLPATLLNLSPENWMDTHYLEPLINGLWDSTKLDERTAKRVAFFDRDSSIEHVESPYMVIAAVNDPEEGNTIRVMFDQGAQGGFAELEELVRKTVTDECAERMGKLLIEQAGLATLPEQNELALSA